MMACQARCRPIVCVGQGLWWHTTPDVVQPCMLSKSNDGMTRPTSSHHMCYPRAKMSCHARRHQAACATQWWWRHATSDVIQSFVLPKVHEGIAHPTSSDLVCCLTALITSHDRCRPIVYAFQGQWWNTLPDVVRPCVHSKGNDGTAMPNVWLCLLPNGHDGIPYST